MYRRVWTISSKRKLESYPINKRTKYFRDDLISKKVSAAISALKRIRSYIKELDKKKIMKCAKGRAEIKQDDIEVF
jgi:hypothetical protein